MEELEELKKENEKLKLQYDAKTDLISISAHQLRTSLSAVKWILKMFKDNDLGPTTIEQKDYLEKAYDSNEMMIAHINNLLTLNHASDMSVGLHLEKIDLIELINKIIIEFSAEAHKKKIIIDILKSTDSFFINADLEMLRVVFQNLIENAIKYSNENSIVSLSLKLIEGTNSIEIMIKDSGIGIEPDDQKSIFDKFFRAPNAVKKESSGSGLGLYTARNIVERHGGNIRFESTTNGTTFFVVLPVSSVI